MVGLRQSGFQLGVRVPATGEAGAGAVLLVDTLDSLRAVGGRAGDLAAGVVLPGAADPGEAFATLLWAACGPTGPARRVPAVVARDLPGAGWHEILVCARVGTSPYAALREVTARGGGLPGPVACLTLGGSGLQGQHGRAWAAEPGNLHLSVGLPCDLEAATCGPPLPMLAAVALCDAVEDLVGRAAAAAAGLGVKWVNDVVLGGGKLGGVLTSMRTRGARVTEVFAGVALNLAAAPRLEPDPFALPAVALAAAGAPPPLGTAAAAVLGRLRARLDELAAQGPGALVDAYRSRSVVLGREVGIWAAELRQRPAAGPARAALPPPARRGTVVAIHPDLSLALAGQDEPVRSGCLRLLDGRAGARMSR